MTNGGNPYRSYSYDPNGNATADGGNQTINYNLLNLPASVTQGGTTKATYTYDASGAKLRNTGTDGSWDYINGIVYHNGTIAFISTEEGRTIPNGAGYSYQYNLKDHLGNDRVSLDQNGVLQEDEYYAFGLRNAKYDNSNNNRYLYNGKEIQTDLANQYDYGARFYDPVIARWTSVDPLAEKGRRETPYGYAFDDPMRFTDPDGMWPDGGWDGVRDFLSGGLQAYASDVTTITGKGVPDAPHSDDAAYNLGQKVGHLIAGVQGTTEMISGGGAVAAGAVGAPETLGASLTISAAGATQFVHGANTIKNTFVNMASQSNTATPSTSQPNGNSLSSQKPQHGYEIRDQHGNVTEYGISGQKTKVDATGVVKSPRIAQKLKAKYSGSSGNKGFVTNFFKNRVDAVQWEKDQVQAYKDANNGAKPPRQIRP